MKGLFLAVLLMVIGAQAQAESKGHSTDSGIKTIRDYK